MMNEEKYMFEALKEASIAFDENEVPVGAIVIKDDKIISKAHNTKERENNPIKHAEINAIEIACKELKSYRLDGCIMYVTLEPCPMCAGAIINSGIEKIVYGAKDERAGSLGSLIDLSKLNYFNHPKLKSGILEDECKELLKKFFLKIRRNNGDTF